MRYTIDQILVKFNMEKFLLTLVVNFHHIHKVKAIPVTGHEGP
jgi:hypothetical protein